MGNGWAYNPLSQEWYRQGLPPPNPPTPNDGLLYVDDWLFFKDADTGNLNIRAPDGTIMTLANAA